MADKDHVILFENSLVMMRRLAEKMKDMDAPDDRLRAYSRVLMRISTIGKVRLKELAIFSEQTTSNLCTTLKHMEQDGLITGERDTHDRRNVWYSLTPEGVKAADMVMKSLRKFISALFGRLNEKDEARLIKALHVLNETLDKSLNSCDDGDTK